jgi:hypothetical protein
MKGQTTCCGIVQRATILPTLLALLLTLPLLTWAGGEAGLVSRHTDREWARSDALVGATPVPLIDLGKGTYWGFEGGLYPGGANTMPPQHDRVGLERARRIQPLDADGQPDPQGAYVLLSVGMSNPSQEFCGNGVDGVTCNDWTFMGQAARHPEVDHRQLVLVNGALMSQTADSWTTPYAANYDRIRDLILTPLGLSEKQVQIVWLKVANGWPTTPLPFVEADAYLLLSSMGDILRSLKLRYPNLQQVFISSRIYAGNAAIGLNPEPYAYESGFAVKWLIEAQIRQMQSRDGQIDDRAGDLNYDTVAPWIAWGPYLWADGLDPRSDGLVWRSVDFEADGTHPSTLGEHKVGTMLLHFFMTSPHTRCWFLAANSCGND